MRKRIQSKRRLRFRVWQVIVAVAVVAAGVVGGTRLYTAFTEPPKVSLQTKASQPAASSQTPSEDTSLQADNPAQIDTASLPADEKIAFLTFDDGPSQYTSKLLDTLQQNDIKATFFVTFFGHDSAVKRGWVKQELDDGETIGEHSWTHEYSYIYASEENFMTDFNTMKQVLTDTTGAQPRLFRFPGGVGNTEWRRYHHNEPIMSTLVQDVENAGMTPFDWTAGGEDASKNPPSSPQQFCDEIMNDIGEQEHPIILMHDRIENSVNTVPLVIEQLRAKGYRFATLSPEMTPVTQKPASPRKS